MREIKQYAKDHKKLQLASGEAWTPMKDNEGQLNKSTIYKNKRLPFTSR